MGYGLKFITNAVQQWLAKSGVKSLDITLASPWENG